GTEFVPTVASHASENQRMAEPTCRGPVTEIAKLVHEHYVGPQLTQSFDQLEEDFPRLVRMIYLAHGHPHFSQDSLVVSATAEVKKTHINSGMKQRPGNVNGLLL